MSETPEYSPLENSSLPEVAPPSARPEEAPKAEIIRQPLPDSPMERARLESQGKIPRRSEWEDRSTQVAFGLLFVVPLLIIIFAVLLLLPYINSQLSPDANPGGAIVQSGPSNLPPTR